MSNRLCLFLIGTIIYSCCPQQKKLDDLLSAYPYLFVVMNVCFNNDSSIVRQVCYPFNDIIYLLGTDSMTTNLVEDINNFKQTIIKGEAITLPTEHSLLKTVINDDREVDSIFIFGYKALLEKYFFCYNEFDKIHCCCYNQLHSSCDNSVYFGHWSTPYYIKDGDVVYDDNQKFYVISLLFQNNIYCNMDSNGNIHLLKYNLYSEDFSRIPFPNIEIR